VIADHGDRKEEDAASSPPPSRPGASIFTIEGRAAPGLFVVGWLATIIGLGLTIIGVIGRAPVLALPGLVLLSLGLLAAAGGQAIERRARGRDAYQGPSPVLAFAASIAVTLLVGSLVGLGLSILSISAAGPGGDLLAILIQASAYIGVIALTVVGTGALTWRDMGFTRSIAGAAEDAGWGAVFAGPVIIATLIVQVFLVAIFRVTPESPLTPTNESIGFLFNLLAGAVVAPIGEEVMFRGLATTAWARSLGVTQGIVRAGLFFALAHILTTSATSAGTGIALAIVGFGARVPVALVLGWVFVRRGSIWASIGLHAAFNGILLVLARAALPA
jgi:membrane protease YdiL (CAAX protease family)